MAGRLAATAAAAGVGIGRRIEELRRRRRWSRSDLAAEAGVSRQYIGEIEKGEKSNPGVAVLDRISRALGWASSHEMMESEELEAPGAWVVREADGRGDRGGAGEGDGAADDEEGVVWARSREVTPVVEAPYEAFLEVPIVATLTAGTGSGVGGTIEGYVHVLKEEARGRELLAARVRGECMMPLLYSGDIVIYERVHSPEDVPSGALCVVTLLDEGDGETDGGNVKYVDWVSGVARLRSEDPSYPAKVVPRDRVLVEGKVWRMIREF